MAMSELREQVVAAAGREEARAAVREIYSSLQDDIDARKPVCRASGRCCRFEEFGHRLYVTTLELAAFVAELPSRRPEDSRAGALPILSDRPPPGCPYQVDGLCGVHAIRPFGCRIFFCDSTSAQWQSERYERYHAELKRLHARLNVRYFYVEWRQALRELGLMDFRLSQSDLKL